MIIILLLAVKYSRFKKKVSLYLTKGCLSVMFLDHTTHFLRYTIRRITERKKNKDFIAMIRKVSFRGIRLLIHSVEPRYLELGYFEVPAISKEDRIPLDLPLCFLSFTISYFELGYFEFPAISKSSFFPYTLNQPRYIKLVKTRVRT